MRGRAACCCASWHLGFLIAALANPSIRNEEREPLTDIAVAVIDRSLSQQNGDRIATNRCGRSSPEAGRGPPRQHRTPHRRSAIRHQRRGRRHPRLRGPEPGAGRNPAGAFRRRHHGHRWPDSRCAGRSGEEQHRRTGARPADRLEDRARPQGGDRQGAALRHRRQGPDHHLPRRGSERPRRTAWMSRCSSAAATRRPSP